MRNNGDGVGGLGVAQFDDMHNAIDFVVCFLLDLHKNQQLEAGERIFKTITYFSQSLDDFINISIVSRYTA